MSIPIRNTGQLSVIANERTFFVTTSTWGKCGILQSDHAAKLLIDVLYHYRKERKYLLHEFVIMPDHIHLLITLDAEMTVEKSIQLIKGGFSFRAGRELGFRAPVWQKGFGDSSARSDGVCGNARIYSRESGETLLGGIGFRLCVFISAPRICLGSTATAPKGAVRG